MRTFILFLVLMNVALLAYFTLQKAMTTTTVTHKELNADKIELVMDKDVDSLPKKTFVARPLNNCYKWSGFTSANLEGGKAVMARLGLEATVVKESDTGKQRRFWVYYPPLATPEKAQAKADEIRGLGVSELYIVQDAKWRNAISFGLFSEEKLAINLLKELKRKGVNHAVKSVRNQDDMISSLVAKSVDAETAVALYKTRLEFLGTDITPVACQ